MSVLPACATALFDKNMSVKSVEINALACTFPFVANSKLFDDIASKDVNLVEASLDPKIVKMAKKRGKERDPWQAAEELLRTFSEETFLIN